MAAAVGVLCARVRVEEKQIIAALAAAGVPARPVSPTGLPLSVGPVPPPLLGAVPACGERAELIVDRCQDRAVAAAILPLWRASGAVVLDAGLAATGDRLAVARALVAAGIPRPASYLAPSGEAALAALAVLGYPATLLPLTAGVAGVALLDRDVAEAVLEHRGVLGAAGDAVALVQAGACRPSERVTVVVVDGRAVAMLDPAGLAHYPARVIGTAEAAAATLGAAIAGVEIAMTPAGLVVWDVNPVPEFRAAVPLDEATVAEAIADLAAGRRPCQGGIGGALEIQPPLGEALGLGSILGREVADGVALSA